MNLKAIKGFKDILPGDVEAWQHLERKARELLEVYGYSEIKVPVLEFTELFSRSIGEATDIVEKEMYTFEDRDGKKVTLRPEGTASVVRAYIEHHLHETSSLTKVYYIGPMFRHERPQAGRLRQFYQIGAEILGTQDPYADVELLALVHELLVRLDIHPFHLEINSVGCEVCRPRYKKALGDFLKGHADKLCENCRRRLTTNPLRILDCKEKGCREITQKAPMIQSYLCEECAPHFKTVLEGLSQTGIPYHINPRLVRGLDYYTKTAFEWTSPSLGAQNAFLGGGRYDGLVQMLGGPKIPGSGFSMGMERMITLMKKDLLPPAPAYYITSLGEKAKELSFSIATQLRSKGIRVELDYQGGSLKSQMRRANRSQAPYVLMIGENELKKGKIILRDMLQKTQKEVEISSLPKSLIPSPE